MRQDDSLPQTLQTRRITDFSVIEALYQSILPAPFLKTRFRVRIE